MLILYFIIVFFIFLFNVLIPLVIEKIQIEEQITSSDLGKKIQKITCYNNVWFYIEKNIFGLNLRYFIDNNNNILSCDKDFTSAKTGKTCGQNGEFNNRYHPCYGLLSELLFYRK